MDSSRSLTEWLNYKGDLSFDMMTGVITMDASDENKSEATTSTTCSMVSHTESELHGSDGLFDTYHEQHELCVLCGSCKAEHTPRHKFISCKPQYRCMDCGKYFYEHSHVNSCYHPMIPVNMDDS